MDRYLKACQAAERIINDVVASGFELCDAESIIRNGYSYLPDHIQYAYGASRLVLWDVEYCDYVVKIAQDEHCEKYCQHEVEIYEAAIKEGVADSFAWCACYREPDWDEGEPGIYVMEYLDCNEDEVYDDAWCHGYKEYCRSHGLDASNYDNASQYDNWNKSDDSDLVLDLLESNMSNEYRRMFEVFMCKWEITDIHQGNISCLCDGHRKIVDYGGWGW